MNRYSDRIAHRNVATIAIQRASSFCSSVMNRSRKTAAMIGIKRIAFSTPAFKANVLIPSISLPSDGSSRAEEAGDSLVNDGHDPIGPDTCDEHQRHQWGQRYDLTNFDLQMMTTPVFVDRAVQDRANTF